ncbi:50S ribosomal protein L6 [Psittacicella hinzii]|uniref:Large ribosomal subunit protein uL6 n=1 Tax=Psittacicella hinzii TaxID=2028575 RepID=A0A3A1Y739_9GAMM|nr:50S ribosomal protein L6 [Psittacicella hinzii]RIY34093.1 50S ribosomal protein L6 [Psittacicella hinzii]
MSRVAKTPVSIPSGVEVNVNGQLVTVKGPKGSLELTVNSQVSIAVQDNQVSFNWQGREEGVSSEQAGTARALINNMVKGVSEGFTRGLQLKGVGYRASIKGNTLTLALGYSHPIEHVLPEGVTAECPSQQEIVLRAIDKQLVGQQAAIIRSYRKPEPYKGHGVRYTDEVVRIREVKKK